jgi:hypothetical protein
METKRMSFDDIPMMVEAEGMKVRGTHDGKIVVNYWEMGPNQDLGPAIKERLGDGLCPCPHWGYILEGSFIVFDTQGKEVAFNAGDIGYWAPGHAAKAGSNGCKLVDFSPYDEIKPVLKQFAGIEI